MANRLFKVLFCLLWFLSTSTAWAQVELIVPSDTIHNAHPVTFRLLVPEQGAVERIDFSNWSRLYQADVDYEWADFGLWSPNKKDTVSFIHKEEIAWEPVSFNGKKMRSNRFNIVFWSDGPVYLPSIIVEMKNGNRIATRPQSVFVSSPLTENPDLADPEKMAPIKPIMGVNQAGMPSWLLLTILLGLAILIGGLAFWIFRKRKVSKPEKALVQLNPLEGFQQSVAHLSVNSDSNRFYTNALKALKTYVDKASDISALGLSNSDFATALESFFATNSTETWFLNNKPEFVELLQRSAAAKFAGVNFDQETHKSDLDLAKAIVEKMEATFQSQSMPSEA